MNNYALVQKKDAAVTVVATVQASTQGQASRKLYRAHHIEPTKARDLGFSVEFQKPQKEAHHG